MIASFTSPSTIDPKLDLNKCSPRKSKNRQGFKKGEKWRDLLSAMTFSLKQRRSALSPLQQKAGRREIHCKIEKRYHFW